MKKLRFAIIGLGHFGKNYLRLLEETPGVELVAIASRSKRSFTKNKKNIPAHVHLTTKPAEIFSNPAVDCVVIATPPGTHAVLICAALSNGKHTLVEKPMVISLAESQTVAKVASKSPSIFMVGYQYVYNDYVKK